ncbi:FecR family protein [Rhizomicrobium palustre]
MEAAADWCDRQGTLSHSERVAFRAWLAADPAHARAFDQIRRVMLDVALLDVVAPGKAATKFSWREWVRGAFEAKATYGVLVGAAATFCAVIVFWPKAPVQVPGAPTEQILATATGQRTNVALTDKSMVYLNAATQVSVRYTDHERRLQLARGEAIFLVSKDKARPFRVITGTAVVTAVGTRFGVDRVGDAVEVRVYEGTVKVEGKGVAGLAVTHGEWLVVDPQRGVRSGHFSPAQYETWQKGWLEADRMPLSYVITRLNRYTEDKIVLSDARLGEIGLNGRFRLDRTDDTLKQIAAILDVEVVKHGHSVVLMPKPQP